VLSPGDVSRDEGDEKRLTAGERVEDGRWGKGKVGMGGIDDRCDSLVDGVGSRLICAEGG
jgi:hypothetical protein